MQRHVRGKAWVIPRTPRYTLEIVLYFLASAKLVQNKRVPGKCRKSEKKLIEHYRHVIQFKTDWF